MNYDTTEARLGVSVLEAARLLGIGRTKIYELLNLGVLRARKIGRRRVISLCSIREFFDGTEGAQAPSPDEERKSEPTAGSV